MEIESIELQTLEDELSGTFCECKHEISEHYVGTITGTVMCLALIFNGAVWSTCGCRRLKEKQFKLVFSVEYYANCQENRANT